MDLIFLRYDKNYYITDGKISIFLDTLISMFNIKTINKNINLKDGDIVTPLILFPKESCKNFINLLESQNIKMNCKFIDDVENYIYYGFEDEDMFFKSLYYFKDNLGNYIYISVEKGNNGVKKVIEHSSFLFNKNEITNLFKIDKKLYLNDLLTNSSLENINDTLFYNNLKYLDLYKIINRISLNQINE